MADEHIEEDQDSTDKTKIEFSEDQQKAINEIISKRIAEKEAKFQAEREQIEARHRKDLEMSKLDEESRMKAQEKERLDQLTKRAEDAEHRLRMSTTEGELIKAGLDPGLADCLMGVDDSERPKRIDMIVKAAKRLADDMYADRVKSGSPVAPNSGADKAMLDMMRSAAGLRPSP